MGSGADQQGQPQELKPLASLWSSQVSEGNRVPGVAARGLRPKVSERLVRSAGLGVAGGCLADDAVRVLAATTRAAQAVVAALGQLHAAGGGQVAE